MLRNVENFGFLNWRSFSSYPIMILSPVTNEPIDLFKIQTGVLWVFCCPCPSFYKNVLLYLRQGTAPKLTPIRGKGSLCVSWETNASCYRPVDLLQTYLRLCECCILVLTSRWRLKPQITQCPFLMWPFSALEHFIEPYISWMYLMELFYIWLIFDLQVVKQYIQQSILEKELLYFGYEAFGITFVDPVSKEILCYHHILLIWCGGVMQALYLTCVFLVILYSGHVDSWRRHA